MITEWQGSTFRLTPWRTFNRKLLDFCLCKPHMHKHWLLIYTPCTVNSYFAVGITFDGKHWNGKSTSCIKVVKGPALVRLLPRNKPIGDVYMKRDLLKETSSSDYRGWQVQIYRTNVPIWVWSLAGCSISRESGCPSPKPVRQKSLLLGGSSVFVLCSPSVEWMRPSTYGGQSSLLILQI